MVVVRLGLDWGWGCGFVWVPKQKKLNLGGRVAGWLGGWDIQKIVLPTLDQPTGFSQRSECGNMLTAQISKYIKYSKPNLLPVVQPGVNPIPQVGACGPLNLGDDAGLYWGGLLVPLLMHQGPGNDVGDDDGLAAPESVIYIIIIHSCTA